MLPAVPVKWAEFAPDLSDYSPEFSDAILNVCPKADGYGPLPSWEQLASATLGAAPKGGWLVRLATGGSALYAGTATALKKFNAATNAWDDVSRLAGGAYAVAAGTYWSGVQFGTRLIVCNGVDATQYIDVDSGSNFAALSNAPIAKFVVSAGDFVVLGNLSTDKKAVAWSGVNDSEAWTAGQKGSDLQPLGDGGDVNGLVGNESGFVILQKDKIRLATRTPGQIVFTIRVVQDKIGCFAPYSVVQVRNSFIWFDQGGFYEGIEANPIGAEKVNEYVRANSTVTAQKSMLGAVDLVREIAWYLIEGASTNFMLGYNWVTKRWTLANLDIDYAFHAVPPGYTFDTWDDLGATFDTLPYTFDSAVWEGTGIQLLAGFKASGAFGYFTGTNLPATLETHDIELSQGGKSFVNCMRVLSDAPVANVTGQVASRQFHGDSLSWSMARAADTNGRIWPNPGKRGVTHRARVAIAASAWNNATGVQLYGMEAGQ